MDRNTHFSPDDEQQAFSLNQGDYYLAIQTGDGYYDYTIYHSDFTEYDGGQLDEPDFTMEEAVESILEDFDLSHLARERCDYDELTESVDQVEQAHILLLRNNQNRSLNDQISSAQEQNVPERDQGIAAKAKEVER